MPRLTPVRTLDVARAIQRGRPRYLSAASGLVRVGDLLYVVADDEHHVGVFPASGPAPGTLVRVRPGTLPARKKERKRAKPDFESILALPPFEGHPSGALLLVGSGSRPNRCGGVLLRLYRDGTIKGAPHAVDLRPLYSALAREFAEVNIEGAFVDHEHLSLLQRGNKTDPRNARVRVALGPVLAALATRRPVGGMAISDVSEFALGTVAGVPLCFTDGAGLPDAGFAFTAVAEDTDDSYADGSHVGSAIGIVGADDRLRALWRLEPALKVEGIAARTTRKTIELTVVTDADDATIAARLLRFRIPYVAPR